MIVHILEPRRYIEIAGFAIRIAVEKHIDIMPALRCQIISAVEFEDLRAVQLNKSMEPVRTIVVGRGSTGLDILA